MSRTRVVLLGMLVLSLAGYGMQVHMAQAAEAPEVRRVPAPLMGRTQMQLPPGGSQQGASIKAMYGERQLPDPLIPDALNFELPRGYPRTSSSEWQAREKHEHRKLIETGRFDALVLPFQVIGEGFDQSTRSLMTATLSQAVARATRWRLPDAQVVAKALGDGARTLAAKDVFDLADALGVQHIVGGYAGHSADEVMNIMAWRMDRQKKTETPRRLPEWSSAIGVRRSLVPGTPLAEGDAPVERFKSRIPDILKGMGMTFVAPDDVKSARLDLQELGETPQSLIGKSDNPANDAYAFLLYAALVPDMMEHEQKMFAEQAYMALERLSDRAPDYRVLRARTLLALGSRKAALQALGGPASNEERGVQAYANGNLPDLQEAAKKEKHPIKRLLLKLDENRLLMSYGLRNQEQAWAEVKRMGLPGPYWQHLVGRAFVDSEGWAQFDNALTKHLMDKAYPIKGFVLEEMVKGLASLGNPSKLQALADRAFIDHAQKRREADPARWCCRAVPGRLGHGDYLALLLSIGHDNLLRRIRFYAVVQSDGAGALAFANSLDTIYKGMPYFELMKSKAELKYAKEANASEQDGLRKSAYERAFNAMYWEQGQSRISDGAATQIRNTGRSDYGPLGNLYHADRPYRPYYWTWAAGGNPQALSSNMQAAMSNATSEFHTVGQLHSFYVLGGSGDKVTELLASIEGRFNGAPKKSKLLADIALSRGDREAAKAHYRENAQKFPNYWPSIHWLGWLHFGDGEVHEAAKVWRSYAGFRQGSGENRVELANEAYGVGSTLYWAGHLDLAEPFYLIAKAQNVGAASDISSATRLRLVAGDLSGAFAGLRQRARRYQDTYAYRDYLGLLHAAGRSDEAWAGFASLVRDHPKRPHVWETAMVGHRRAQVSDDALVAWARRPEHLRAGSAGNAGAVYLLRMATTDRIPSAALADVLQELDPPTWQLDTHGNFVVHPVDGNDFPTILGPGTQDTHSTLPRGVFESAKKHRVRSNLALFAAGYRALKLKNWKTAKAAFDEAASLYDLNAQSDFLLPYYAYVQAQAGGQQAAEQLLARIKPSQQGFDYFLARAALEAAKGNRDEAFKYVTRARYARPQTEDRPLLTQYTFGEFMEMLFEQSGDPRLRELALTWAKAFQKIEPWQSWSYAMEARLGKTAAVRGKAMAMAHYLDPGSERLSRLRSQDVERAVKTWGRAQPFELDRKQSSGLQEKI